MLTFLASLHKQVCMSSCTCHSSVDSDEECFYWFLKEPPPQISCDPYPFQTLRLSCTLLIKNTSIRAAKIHWYYRNSVHKSVEDKRLATTRFRPIPLDTVNNNSVTLTSQITVS